jgi:hypothetical protein
VVRTAIEARDWDLVNTGDCAHAVFATAADAVLVTRTGNSR